MRSGSSHLNPCRESDLLWSLHGLKRETLSYNVDFCLSGHFTVSIIQDMEDGMVMVCIWHG